MLTVTCFQSSRVQPIVPELVRAASEPPLSAVPPPERAHTDGDSDLVRSVQSLISQKPVTPSSNATARSQSSPPRYVQSCGTHWALYLPIMLPSAAPTGALTLRADQAQTGLLCLRQEARSTTLPNGKGTFQQTSKRATYAQTTEPRVTRAWSLRNPRATRSPPSLPADIRRQLQHIASSFP